jgi:putative ABC transport system permease protein
MRKVSRRNLSAHKIRLALTVLSVVLGTAFVAGSFVFTDTLKSTFTGIFADVGKGYEAQVTAKQDGSSGVPLADLNTIKTLPGVRTAVPGVGGQVVLIGSNGKSVQSGGAPTEGLAYRPPAQQLGDPVQFSAGQPPASDNQIALNIGAVKLSGLKLGDHTKVLVPSEGSVDVTLTGIYKTKTDTGGYVGVLFNADQAMKLFTDGAHVQSIQVAATSGVSQQELKARLQAALPDQKIQTAKEVKDQTQADLNSALSFINYFLLAFAAVALLVGTFIIYNTFSMIVAQRVRELALLRAVGAGRKQVSRSVLFEAVIVGFIGSALGIAAGVGLATSLRALLNALNLGLPKGPLKLEPHTILIALAVGVVVTAFSAYAPARRAAKIPPVAAMREEFASTGSSLRKRTALGLFFAVLAVLALAVGAAGKSGGSSAGMVGLGALAMIVAVLLGAPALSRPIVGLVGLAIRPFGPVGRLARTNATRNPRRTAATAFALTLGLMLVSAIAVIGASAKHTINSLVDNGVTADYVLTGPNAIGVPIGAGVAAAKVPDVQTALTLHPVTVLIDGKHTQGTGVDGSLPDVLPYQLVAGTGDLSGNNMLISQRSANDNHWSVGSTVAMTTTDQKSVTTKVVGIYKNNQLLGPWLTSNGFYRQVTPTRQLVDEVVLVKAKPGADLKAVRTSLEKATDPYLVVQVQTRAEFKGSQANQINGLLGILYALLALAIVIAILGIVNTLALSVVERRREIGMLRAVGMLRGQLRRTIYLESMLIAVFGAVVGVAMGLTFGSLFVHTLRDQGLDSIAVPWTQAVVFLVVSAVVGVLAALWPASRAAKTRPLEAIADI